MHPHMNILLCVVISLFKVTNEVLLRRKQMTM